MPYTDVTAEQFANGFQLRIGYANGRIYGFIDGELFVSYEEPDFAGGYLGFNNYYGNIEFSDIHYMVGNMDAAKATPLADSSPKTVDLGFNTAWKTVSGTWSVSAEDVITGKGGSGNQYGMTYEYTAPGQPFVYEANLSITGTAGGLAFGVGNLQTISSGMYGVNIVPSAKRVRLFSVLIGDQGDNMDTNAKGTLTAEQVAANDYHLKVIYDGSAISFYVDDVLLGSRGERAFNGGYIGLFVNNATVTFSNVKLTLGEIAIPTEDVRLTIDGKTTVLPAGTHLYTMDLGRTDAPMTLAMQVADGYTVSSAYPTERQGNVYTLSLPAAYGYKNYTVTFTDAEGKRNVLLLRTWRLTAGDDPYGDIYRPYMHYTAADNWISDPNGLVYDATTGVYHMFMQRKPDILSGTASWGHAISTDLIHWEPLENALTTDEITKSHWSGAAVVDKQNTSGLFDESIPAASRLIVFYTHVSSEFAIHIAYSTDDGMTWQKYSGNPVISAAEADGSGQRDPMVIWYEDAEQPNGGIWLMFIYGGDGKATRIFSSSDLIHWSFNSDLTDVNGNKLISECPSVVRLPLNGDENDQKWVYIGAGIYMSKATIYLIGDIVKDADGNYNFVAEQKLLDDYGVCSFIRTYATQTYAGLTDGRTIAVSWLRERTAGVYVEDKPWNGAESLPLSLSLATGRDGLMHLRAYPVEEYKSALGKTLYCANDLVLNAGDCLLDGVTATAYVIETTLHPSADAVGRFNLRVGDGCLASVTCAMQTDGGALITVDTTEANVLSLGGRYSVTVTPDENGDVDLLIIMDNSVLSVYGQNGEGFTYDLLYAEPTHIGMSMEVLDGSIGVQSLFCREINSIWYNDAHTHEYTETVTVKPSCTVAGLATYTCDCGDSYTMTLPAIGEHTYGEGVFTMVDDKTAKMVYVCSVCGEETAVKVEDLVVEDVVEDEKIAAKMIELGNGEIAFVAAVDSLDYASAGFAITVGGETRTFTVDTVYAKITAGNVVFTSAYFGEESGYVYGIRIRGVRAEQVGAFTKVLNGGAEK